MKNEFVNSNTGKLVISSMCVALITVCSWISVPLAVPFTLQTMGVFVTALLLDMKYSFASIIAYMLLGLVGVPVFSGFKSGYQALFGLTGGYIFGFVFIILCVGIAKKAFGDKIISNCISMLIGLVLCYLCGTVWFVFVYTKSTGNIGFWTSLSMCVLPFIIPDIVKMAISVLLVERLKKAVNIKSLPQN